MTMCLINEFEIDGVRIDESFKSSLPSIYAPAPNPDQLQGYSVTECSLTKELLKPNELTFNLRRETIKKNDNVKHYTIVDYLIGKEVSCNVETQLDGQVESKLVYTGKIAKVSMKGLTVTCVAYTKDHMLMGAPRCRCFMGKKLDEIVNEVATGVDVRVAVHSDFQNLVFPYIVQYNESNYDFLVRLAKRFGAFLYYHDKESAIPNDQACLVFGKLPNNQTKDIQNSSYAASYELQMGDPNFKFLAHYYEKDKDLDSQVSGYNVLSPKKLSKKAMDVSTAFVQAASYRIDYPGSLPQDPADDLVDNYSWRQMISDSESMVTCKFISYLFDVQVGNIVKINDNDLMLVTSTHLTWDCNGSPQNEITAFALPSDTVNTNAIFAPYTDFNAYPKSSAQRAVVLNNVDPLKMGRVQVQFIWQKDLPDADKNNLPWIRIAQPYGGGKKNKEQGCYILPEIGEEVMVGFEHDNLEKPYVIGTLYHDSDTADNVQMPDPAWLETDQANKSNEVKAFRTKKGHTIEIHDVDGDDNYGFIRIYGKNQADKNYDIYLSSNPVKNGDEFYKVNGPKEDAEEKKEIGLQSYEAKELRIMVKSNGGDIVLDAGDGDIILNAKNLRVNVTGNRTMAIQEDDIVRVGGKRFVDADCDSLVLRGKQTVLVNGELEAEYKGAVQAKADKAVKINAQSIAAETDQKTEMKASEFNAEATQAAKLKTNSGIELDGGMKVDIQATNFKAEGRASATLKGTDVTVDALVSATVKATNVTLDSEAGTRKGMWSDM